MKILFKISGLVIGLILISCNQKTEVSQKAKEAFKNKFPEAKNVSWEMEEENVWEAEFKMNGQLYSANFNNDGEWKETEIEIEEIDLPIAVEDALKSKYPEVEIEEFSKVESESGTSYEVEFKENESTREVVFDSDGNVIQSKTSDDDEEDELEDDDH